MSRTVALLILIFSLAIGCDRDSEPAAAPDEPVEEQEVDEPKEEEPTADDDEGGWQNEAIGDLELGQPEAEVRFSLGDPTETGDEQFQGADGLYVQQLTYDDLGIELWMHSEEEGAPKEVASITISEPSDLTTKKGIRIGSTEAEVQEAYESLHNEEESEPGTTFVAGSIYGGLIFTFEDDKVTSIFLGASAE